MNMENRDDRLKNALGWFSIGLGLAEALAPGKMADLIGAPNRSMTRKLMRAYGVREISAGVGLLSQSAPAVWMWSRVAGDALDLGILAAAMASRRSERTRLITATAAVAGVTALDIYCGTKLVTGKHKTAAPDGDIRVKQSIIIGRSREKVYRYWRDFANFPNFMDHVESVRITGDRTSHWSVKGPAGRSVEWDAEITNDEPNRSISWRSLPGADVDNSGTVRFERAPGDRGTFVRVELTYNPPAGKAGAAIAKLLRQSPKQQIYDDLRALKQILETGQRAKSDASVAPGMHAAQPPAEVPEMALAQ